MIKALYIGMGLFISACMASALDAEQIDSVLNRIENSSEKCLMSVEKAPSDKLHAKPFVYKTLKQVHDNDQEARTTLMPYLQGPLLTPHLKQLKKIDSINARILKIILDANQGWLEASLFGQECNDIVWLIVQHMDEDVGYQKTILEKLQASSLTNKTDASHYAYLYDRIAANEQRPQLYGTQVVLDKETKKHKLREVENPMALNTRRQEVGLEPVEEYLKTVDRVYSVD